MQIVVPHLENAIGTAVAEARAAGLDHVTAFHRAVRLVRVARPDLTPDKAGMLVECAAGLRGEH